MTSHFDNLMRIYAEASEHREFAEIASWLAQICVQQADTKEKGWTFENWLNSGHASFYLKEPFWVQQYYYLNDCHDFLDHKNWHLKVFDVPTIYLIELVYDVVEGNDFYNLNQAKLLKRFPELEQHLLKLGFKKEVKHRQVTFATDKMSIW